LPSCPRPSCPSGGCPRALPADSTPYRRLPSTSSANDSQHLSCLIKALPRMRRLTFRSLTGLSRPNFPMGHFRFAPSGILAESGSPHQCGSLTCSWASRNRLLRSFQYRCVESPSMHAHPHRSLPDFREKCRRASPTPGPLCMIGSDHPKSRSLSILSNHRQGRMGGGGEAGA
jgi:hypothetical protein